MKTIVLSGSASLQKEISDIVNKLKNDYIILDYPKPIEGENFMRVYPKVHKEFYENLMNTDILLLANFDKKGTIGYVGASGFAELNFAITQNFLYNKNIELYILQMPSNNVWCYDEIKLWLDLGWVKIWNK